MRIFVCSAAIGAVTVVVWLNFGWLLGMSFLLWTTAVYLAGLYEGSYIRWACGGRG